MRAAVTTRWFMLLVLGLAPSIVHAGLLRYVSPAGSNTAPFTNWTTAAWTIQTAVQAATNGDTVLVAPGTYGGFGRFTNGPNVVAITNGILLVSSNGPATTIINGGGSNRCLFLSHSNAVVQGFTLQNGLLTATNGISGGPTPWAACGGGVHIKSAGTLRQCIIRSNIAHGIEWMEFEAVDARGGGVYAEATSAGRVVIEDCEITDNAVITSSRTNGFYGGFPYGGGVYLRGANLATITAEVRRCLISGNWTTQSNITNGAEGGGLYLTRKSRAVRCRIENNRAIDGNGAGAVVSGSELRDCMIRFNDADLGGGGVNAYDFSTVLNCVVAGNAGGGIHSYLLSNSFINCVIADNGEMGLFGDGVAAGLTIREGDRAVNCVIYFNQGSMGDSNWDPADSPSFLWPPPTFDYCISVPLPTNGIGNQDLAPMFADDLYRPALGSSALDAGPATTSLVGSVDMDGAPRILNGRADVGPYEAWEWGPVPEGWGPGGTQILWNVVSGVVCYAENTTSLTNPAWTTASGLLTGQPGPLAFVASNAAAHSVFRLRLAPP